MKIVCLSDIHFGYKNNSKTHNEECLAFLDFVREYCEEHLGNEDFITMFMGDWHHVRPTTNNLTLHYSTEGLYSLSNIGGSTTYMLLGNHDLYYRDRRDVSSIVLPSDSLGIEIIDEPIMVDNMLLCPWLIGDEKLKDLIAEYSPEYVFGHFEIPSFKFNSKSTLPGEYNPFDYQGPKRILSGHFHNRDEKNNITYIGNCFSHNFSDANDWHNKGFAILDTTTNKIEYVEWKEAPKYCVSLISKLQEVDFSDNMRIKLINDVNLNNDDINKLIDFLTETKHVVECLVLPSETTLEQDIESVELEDIGNVNTIIPELLKKLDTKEYNTEKLIDIYNKLDIA